MVWNTHSKGKREKNANIQIYENPAPKYGLTKTANSPITEIDNNNSFNSFWSKLMNLKNLIPLDDIKINARISPIGAIE